MLKPPPDRGRRTRRTRSRLPTTVGSRFSRSPGLRPRLGPVMSGFSASDGGRGREIRKARWMTVVEDEIPPIVRRDRRPEVTRRRISGVDAVGTRKRKNRRAPATPEWGDGSFSGLRAGRNRKFPQSSASDAAGTGILRNLPPPTPSEQELFEILRLRRRRDRGCPRISVSSVAETGNFLNPAAPTPLDQEISRTFRRRRRRIRRFPGSSGSGAVRTRSSLDPAAPAPSDQEDSKVFFSRSLRAGALPPVLEEALHLLIHTGSRPWGAPRRTRRGACNSFGLFWVGSSRR